MDREEVTTIIASGAIEARLPGPLNLPGAGAGAGADLCMQTMMNRVADRSAEDTRSRCILKCESSYWRSQNPYVHLRTDGPALVDN